MRSILNMKKRTCLGLECNKEIEDKWFCKECIKKNKKIKTKEGNRRIGSSGHYYRSE